MQWTRHQRSVCKYLQSINAIRSNSRIIAINSQKEVMPADPIIEVLRERADYDFILYESPSLYPVNAFGLVANPLQSRFVGNEKRYSVEPNLYYKILLDEEFQGIVRINPDNVYLGDLVIAHGGGSDYARNNAELHIDNLLLYYVNQGFVKSIKAYFQQPL